MKTLDCRGQQCPQPVIQTRQAFLAEPGQAIRVLVNDTVSRDNISKLASSQGYAVNVAKLDGEFTLDLTPGDSAPARETATAQGPSIVFIGSDQMGNGDQKLGQILMKNFIFTLLESETIPDAVYFVNAGVKLAVGGSDVIEPLEKLADNGVDIAACGLCLEFFDLKEALAVGRITNMLEIVNTLEGAGRIIRP